MRTLKVFNQVTLDGYFTSSSGDLSWAHTDPGDDEWNSFVADNASGNGTLLFGRVTYEMMASYWPTPAAAANSPAVAEGMNRMAKVVVSRSLDRVTWSNTTLFKGDLTAEVLELKNGAGSDIVILGSGSIVAQLAPTGLIDEYQIVVNPVVLGAGRTMFDGIGKPIPLRLTRSRSFGNGNVVLWYRGR